MTDEQTNPGGVEYLHPGADGVTSRPRTKAGLLDHYARREEPTLFLQIDGHNPPSGAWDDLFHPDDDELVFMLTHELMQGASGMRVLVRHDAEATVVARMLRKSADGIESNPCMLNFDAWPRKDDNLIRVLEAPQPHGTDACPVHATGPIDGQTMCNAHVALDNAIFQLLCFYAGIQGEIHELDVTKLRDYVANHPERDLAAGLHRVVLQMVAECLGLPEPARPQAEGERATSA